MDSQNPNRNTQFEMEGLTGLEQSTPLPEPEGQMTAGPQRLQDRQVLKKNALVFSSVRTLTGLGLGETMGYVELLVGLSQRWVSNA